jgi:hypothetical protein
LKKLREQNNRVKNALKPVKVSKETAAKRRESVKGKSIAEQLNAPGRPDWKKRREERQARKAKSDANQKEFNKVLAENTRLVKALSEIRDSAKKSGRITPKRRAEIQKREEKSIRDYGKKK